MSRKFLTPVGLPSGSSLPAAGSVGDLFFKTSDGSIYAHDGATWVVQGGGVGADGPTGPTGAGYDFGPTTFVGPPPPLPSYLGEEDLYVGYQYELPGSIGAYKVGDYVLVTSSDGLGPYLYGYVTDLLDPGTSYERLEITIHRWGNLGTLTWQFTEVHLAVKVSDYSGRPILTPEGIIGPLLSNVNYDYINSGDRYYYYGEVGSYRVGDYVQITMSSDTTNWVRGVVVETYGEGTYDESVVVEFKTWYGYGEQTVGSINLYGRQGDGYAFGKTEFIGPPPPLPSSILFDTYTINDTYSLPGQIGAYKVGDLVRLPSEEDPVNIYLEGQITALNYPNTTLEGVTVTLSALYFNGSTDYHYFHKLSLRGLASTDSPTFTGLATFDDITLTDDASIIGTVTVRDDLVLTGETQTLATITDIDQVPVEVNFSKGESSWETTGFYTATVELGELSVFLMNTSMLSIMQIGSSISVDGEDAVVTNVNTSYPPFYVISVSGALSTNYDVLSIDVAGTQVQVTVDSTSLDDDVAAIGTSHIAVGPDNILVSTSELLPTEVRWVGETSAVIGDLVTMRTTDISKLTGVRYDGVQSSITYSATTGSWSVPGIPFKEDSDSLRIGANAAPSMATLYSSGNTIIGYQAAMPLIGGGSNVVIGSSAGSLGENASRNVAIGRASQASSNAINSTSVGIESLSNATAFTAIAIGDSAGNESNGNDNYFFGWQAGKGLYGNLNTVIGYSGAAYATGDNNIFFGPYAGQNSNGSDNLFIGYQAGENNVGSNSLAISGRGSDGYSNPIITGSFNDLSVNFPGSVKLNQATRENVYTTSTGFNGYTFSLVEGTTVRGPIQYITANATGNGTVNIRHSSSLSLNNWLKVGEAVTVVLQVTNGSTAYYPNAWQIDGTSVTPKWQGGTAPSAGNANSIDIYSLTIQKTASATYTILASQTKFA